MKKTDRPQRPSADTTRTKILQNALKLFIQHGFAGTSMGTLAKTADINQSLIFHHFGSKENLWLQVKAHLLADIVIPAINPKPDSLKDFIASVVDQRIAIYKQRPELVRLISWQRLEPKKRLQLSGIKSFPSTGYDQWIDAILYLQKAGQLTQQFSPDLMVIWLVNSINGYIIDDLSLFKDQPKNQQAYLQMITDGLTRALSP